MYLSFYVIADLQLNITVYLSPKQVGNVAVSDSVNFVFWGLKFAATAHLLPEPVSPIISVFCKS